MQTQDPVVPFRPLPSSLGGLAAGATYQSAKCRCLFFQPAPSVIVSQMMGHIDRGATEALKAFGERQLARGIPQTFFHDWEAVTGYESEARTMLTSWSLDRRNLIRDVEVLTQSKIVAMGVATANLATSVVGVHMRSHTLRQTWDRELASAVRSA